MGNTVTSKKGLIASDQFFTEGLDVEKLYSLNSHASKNWVVRQDPSRPTDPASCIVGADKLREDDPYAIEVLGPDRDPDLYPPQMVRADARLVVLLRNNILQIAGIIASFRRGFRPNWRHKKRGSIYEVVGYLKVQTSTPVTDDEELLIYRGADGLLWGRRPDEFYDGRFEDVSDDSRGFI